MTGRDEQLDASVALAMIADILLGEESLEEILAKVVDLAQRSIPGTDAASITTIVKDVATTTAATGQLALQADEHQYQLGRGPCMDAALAQQAVMVTDMQADDRWPEYAMRAVGEGVGSSLSVPLPVQDRALAALNLYSEQLGAFDDESRAIATEFAHRAGVAVANAQLYADSELLGLQLRSAMESRSTIEQAKGVLMSQSSCSADAAFDLLVRASQRENVKLRDIAERIVQSVQRPD
jgi:GAF domain-containing protein